MRATSPAISAEERRFPVRVGIAMLALTLIPLLVGFFLTPADHIFSWFVVQARDGVSYMAKTNEGLIGHWLYHDPYTSEPHSESLIFATYLFLGQLDRVLHLPVALLYHLVRLAFGGALIWAVYLIAAEIFPERFRRRLGFMLALFGGGIAVIAREQIFGYTLLSLDRAVSGTAAMETMSLAPHIVLVCLGSAWLALILIRHQRAPRAQHLVAAAAWSAVVTLVYPQMGVTWAAIAVVAIFIDGRPRPGSLLLPIAIAVAAVPYVVYGLYLKQTNPIFNHWPPDSDIAIGDPLSYLLWGHILMVPFIVIALRMMFGRGGVREARMLPLRLMVAWIAVTTVLMYTPGAPNLFHRVYYGSFIPFGMLTALGFARALERARGIRRRRFLVYGTLAMSLISIAALTQAVGVPLQHLDDYSLYYPMPEASILKSLHKQVTGDHALVMNAYLSGLWVPALSFQRTYLGLEFETLDTHHKELLAEQFYRLTDGAEVRARAEEIGADYVLWGKYEQDFGGPDVGKLAGWQVVAQDGRAKLYKVTAGMP